jgi:hypothetical protein
MSDPAPGVRHDGCTSTIPPDERAGEATKVGGAGVRPDRLARVLAVLAAVVMLAVAIAAWIDWTDVPPVRSQTATEATVTGDAESAPKPAGPDTDRKKGDGTEKPGKKARARSADTPLEPHRPVPAP